MLKKIKESLKIKPYRKFENFYFRKDADGNYIFYPWGEPGEAYSINQSEKKKINRALVSFLKIGTRLSAG